ncbi:MAG: phosphatidate cytidylyltransferase [Tabrizicola sp.]|uniref:phosphatidate cytidylyltransferase n=1 Tax=Tabrizicola sp. TaxID=2005166 RepID=UPI00273508BF|nr:phosphatidate cytidylyltransferase [Tabrizicola sp.]MDP3264180.1 phosphatidate cytidylyltransferase [Tabrizicola sp.]MDP3649435.1 phosphatidate cytidylyltransferase [Paracoccaceae bacterium]MDZ4088216.1 phosphatidate cytidylyltransferase [Tabrizicola sp.]
MTSPHLIWLLSGVVVILLVASIIGTLLRQRLGDAPNPMLDNLIARTNAWWVMVILLAVAFLAGRTGVILLFALCSFAALREFLTLTTHSREDHWSLVACFFLVLPLQYYLVLIDWYGLYSVFIPVYVFLLLPVLSALRGNPRDFLVRVSETQWALMVCVFCVSHVPAILSLQIPGFEGRNVILIAYLIFIVQLSDVMQYVWGKLIGRTRIAPTLSPSKTWEGLLGGSLTATAVGTLLWWMTPFTMLQAMGICLILTLMGFLGGLVMSAIKRDRGIKDWGHLIAGHGGFIDRLDSVIFAAPIFFHITRYGWSVT